MLSVAAEPLANLVKPRHADLRGSRCRESRAGEAREKERERRIGNRVLVVSVLLAVAVKADFFAIVSHLDAPWDTLGWSRNTPEQLHTTILGAIVTGLSFPSVGSVAPLRSPRFERSRSTASPGP